MNKFKREVLVAAIIGYCVAPENKNEDGSINWDFVMGDLYLDYEISGENEEFALAVFNEVADEVEGVA